eukprot:TRINITY_DN1489_c1_g2_i1.p1 TRINITY_DN1489_c1_g2~~TRINITY_DN1489_c1_g2_i1.p1  ORF type:complete len:1243 (+),score=248.84 TRINITY_DN1489_c1_g2_i1:210-3938(+)
MPVDIRDLLGQLSSKDLSILRDALWPLNKEAEKPDVCKEIVDLDGVKPIVNCLRVQDLEVRRFTLRCLRFLSATESSHNDFRTKGGLQALLKVLKQTFDSGNVDLENTRTILEILENICHVHANRVMLKDLDAVDLLTRCLSIKDPATIQPTLRVMSSLCETEEGLEDSSDMAVIPVLKCCRDKDPETRANAAEFLSKFTFAHPEHRGVQRMIAEWHTIINLLGEQGNELAHLSALDILNNLMGSKVSFSAVHGMDTFVKVVGELGCGMRQVESAALSVIANLCSTETGITNMKNSEGIPMVLTYLRDDADSGLRRLALHLLKYVADHATIKDQIERHDGIALLLRCLYNGGEDDYKTPSAAMHVLSRLLPSTPPEISGTEAEFLRADMQALKALVGIIQGSDRISRMQAAKLLEGASQHVRFRRALAQVKPTTGPDICSDDDDIRMVAFQFYRTENSRLAVEQGAKSQDGSEVAGEDDDAGSHSGPEWETPMAGDEDTGNADDNEGGSAGGDNATESSKTATEMVIEHKHRCVYSAQVQALQAELSLSRDTTDLTKKELGLEIEYWRAVAERKIRELVNVKHNPTSGEDEEAGDKQKKSEGSSDEDDEDAAILGLRQHPASKGGDGNKSGASTTTRAPSSASLKSAGATSTTEGVDRSLVLLKAEKSLLESEVQRMQGELLSVYKREAISKLRISDLERMIGQQSIGEYDKQDNERERLSELEAQVSLLQGQLDARDPSLPQTRLSVVRPLIERHDAYVALLRKEMLALTRERDALSTRCDSLMRRLSQRRMGGHGRDNTRSGNTLPGTAGPDEGLVAQLELLTDQHEKLKEKLAVQQFKLVSLGYDDRTEEIKTESGASAAIVQSQSNGGAVVTNHSAEMLQSRVDALEQQVKKKDAVITQLHALVEQYQTERTEGAGGEAGAVHQAIKPLDELTSAPSSQAGGGGGGGGGSGGGGSEPGVTAADTVLAPATATVINSFSEAFELESTMLRERIADVQMLRRALKQARIERAAFNKTPKTALLTANGEHVNAGMNGGGVMMLAGHPPGSPHGTNGTLAAQRAGEAVAPPPPPQPPKTRTPGARTPRASNVSSTPRNRRSSSSLAATTPNGTGASPPLSPRSRATSSTADLTSLEAAGGDASNQARMARLQRRIDAVKIENARLEGELHAAEAKNQKQGFHIDRQNGENEALRATLIAAKEQLYTLMMSRKSAPPKPPGVGESASQRPSQSSGPAASLADA